MWRQHRPGFAHGVTGDRPAPSQQVFTHRQTDAWLLLKRGGVDEGYHLFVLPRDRERETWIEAYNKQHAAKLGARFTPYPTGYDDVDA